MRGRRGGPRLRQPRGGCRALARAGTNAPAGEQPGVPGTGSTGAAGAGGAVSCASAWRCLLSGGGACCGVRWQWSAQQAALCPRSVRHASGGHRAAGRSCRARWVSHPPPRCLVRRQPPSPKAHRMVRHPAARVVPAWGAAVGHREARAPASVPSHPTRACRRRRIASAPTSLRLLAAPEAWR